MRRIDEPHLNLPCAGARMMRDLPRAEDIVIGREKVAPMTRRMGIAAVYWRPDTAKPVPGHEITHSPDPGPLTINPAELPLIENETVFDQTRPPLLLLPEILPLTTKMYGRITGTLAGKISSARQVMSLAWAAR